MIHRGWRIRHDCCSHLPTCCPPRSRPLRSCPHPRSCHLWRNPMSRARSCCRCGDYQICCPRHPSPPTCCRAIQRSLIQRQPTTRIRIRGCHCHSCQNRNRTGAIRRRPTPLSHSPDDCRCLPASRTGESQRRQIRTPGDCHLRRSWEQPNRRHANPSRRPSCPRRSCCFRRPNRKPLSPSGRHWSRRRSCCWRRHCRCAIHWRWPSGPVRCPSAPDNARRPLSQSGCRCCRRSVQRRWCAPLNRKHGRRTWVLQQHFRRQHCHRRPIQQLTQLGRRKTCH